MLNSQTQEGSNMNDQKPGKETEERKQSHIDICCDYGEDIEMSITTGFEDIQLINTPLPELNYDDIDLTTTFLKHDFKFPIFISAITGGTKKTKKINERLAKLAEQFGIGMGVGSQRAAIEKKKNAESFSIVREYAPNAFIAGNIGAVQFNYGFTIENANEAIDMINADALVLHLNPLQELIQPEGDTNFGDLISKIKKLGNELKKPLIIKEVGSGFSYNDIKKLEDCNISAIEIAGAGGTSWSQIEAIRAKQQNFPIKQKVGELFKNWGIPTAISTLEVSQFSNKHQIISSGGIRNGLEAAKALAIGANLVGIALPFACLAATATEKQLIDWLEQFIHELKAAMFLVGAPTVKKLQKTPYVILGKTAQWRESRKISH